MKQENQAADLRRRTQNRHLISLISMNGTIDLLFDLGQDPMHLPTHHTHAHLAHPQHISHECIAFPSCPRMNRATGTGPATPTSPERLQTTRTNQKASSPQSTWIRLPTSNYGELHLWACRHHTSTKDRDPFLRYFSYEPPGPLYTCIQR